MTAVTIPNLPVAIALNGTEQMEAVQGGVSSRITTSQIANLAVGGAYPAAGIAYSTGTSWGTSYTTSGTGTALVLTAGATIGTATITASSINSTPIGASARSTGAFTDLALTNALPTTSGGTGVSTAANGQLLIGNGTGFTLSTLTQGSGITITNASGAITIAATGSAGVTTFSAGTTGFTPNTATSGAVTLAGTLGVANGGTGVTVSSGANSVVLRDANQNISVNNVYSGYSNTAAAGTTTTLTAASAFSYNVSGSGGQTFKLPDATTLPVGAVYTFNNNQSSGTIVVQNNSSTTITTLQSGAIVYVILLTNSIAAGTWDTHYGLPSAVSWSTNTLTWTGTIASGTTWNGVAIGLLYGGTGATTAAGARTNLGLGTISTQDASAVAITGGTVSGTRINPRIGTVASAATITPTGDTSDQYNVTALAVAATIAAPSGTPVDGQKLTLRIKDNGTARALTWTTSSGGYRIVGTTLPTTTVISKTVYVGCVYNAADVFWDVVAIAQQA